MKIAKPFSTPLAVAGPLAIAGICLLAGTAVTGCSGDAPQNVLLITIDTLRADRLGVYGNPAQPSPHLDAFADESTLFENCLTPIATTLPSHSTMFTGLYPRAHGVRWNRMQLSDEATTVAEILNEAGFETASFVSMILLRRSVAQGFEIREMPSKPERRNSPAATSEVFVDWLENRTDSRRFFAWVHYWDPHSPYPSTPYSEERLSQYAGPWKEGISAKNFYRAPWSRDPDQTAAIRTLYDGTVHRTDDAVATVLAALERQGLDDSTLVIITADHGQSLGDHGIRGHGPTLWNSALHVPLIVRDGSRRVARRVDTPVSLVDLAPTMLEALGQEIPPGLQGRSLMGAIRGGDLRPRPIYAETRVRGNKIGNRKRFERVAVIDGRLKLVDYVHRQYLYDLEADPGELQELEPDSESEERARLLELAQKYRDQPARHGAEVTTSEEDIELLRSLGYVD